MSTTGRAGVLRLAALLAFALVISLAAYPPQAVLAAAPIGQTIWLRAVTNNLYVAADQNLANVPLVANRPAVGGAWEAFQIVDAGGGYIALRAVTNNLYVSADQNLANVQLVANRPSIGAWEQFQWIDIAAGQVQLRAIGNNRYVSADSNLGSTVPLVANRTTASGWETFSWGVIGSSPTPVPTVPPSTTPNFGPNVIIFDPSMSTSSIQSQINSVYAIQQNNHFGDQRHALVFKPGNYSGLDIPVGFYTHVLGVGASPDNVSISGNLHSDAFLSGDNATQNFWRGAEGFAITPSVSPMQWAVSQAVPFRRMHVRGNIKLNQNNGWSSGGWFSDVLVDGNVNSASQQQWISRNSQWGSWTGSNWNMVFVGVVNAPAGNWPSPPYTKIAQTPIVREKPFLTIDSSGNWGVRVPSLRTNSSGITWAGGSTPGTTIPIGSFHIARAGVDTAATINAQLAAGKHLLLTPGIYNLNDTIRVNNPNTVVLGIGFATLRANTGLSALNIADVDGVTVAGLFIDAGLTNSPVLMEVGPAGSSASHAANPTVLHDVFFRVGGAAAGKASVNLRINSHDVIVDHTWIWRADHGAGVGWTSNTSANGLVVNGNNVTIYGLFVEHYQQFQVLWNGNGGRVYFYQSEIPYDPPNQASWNSAAGTNGWASYKVANNVTSHEAWGLGVYSVFTYPNVWLSRAIEAPNTPNVRFHNMITVALGGNGGISNVINNVGGATQVNAAYTPKVTNYP
ncbi:MAG TPA: coagulation factor 5/8 type domain-containing protein [Roseiflexaceae bacterium]|nr:coagulation factor 5/8 type domain-containing protein [Roseiflexaceae bacterium]